MILQLYLNLNVSFHLLLKRLLETIHKVVYLMSREFISKWITTKLIILLQQGVSLFGKMAYRIAKLCGYLTERASGKSLGFQRLKIKMLYLLGLTKSFLEKLTNLLQVVTLTIMIQLPMVEGLMLLLMYFINLVCQAMRLCSLYVSTLIDRLKQKYFTKT